MRSILKMISNLMLLTGLGVCGLWLLASILGMVDPGVVWDVVVTVGLPLAGSGAIGYVLTGQLRDDMRWLFNT